MVSKTRICNMALSHLANGKDIANLDNEKTQGAAVCRIFYETAKEKTLGDLDWTFATKFATLNLIEENPTDEWRYSYRYPVDCLTFRRILSGVRNDTQDTRIVYKISKDAVGKIIYTDEADAKAEYTENLTDTSFFSPGFTLALSYKIADLAAPRLTGGDPFKLREKAIELYKTEIADAKKKNLNEEVNDQRPESELITARS